MALKFSGYMQTLLTMLQFPEDIARRYVLLLDPMLGEKPDLLNCASRLLQSLQATGGSAIKAVEVLKEHGVPENRIIFINLVHLPFISISLIMK